MILSKRASIKCVCLDLDNTLVRTGEIVNGIRSQVVNYLKCELTEKLGEEYRREYFSDFESSFSFIIDEFGSNYQYHLDQLLINYGLDPVEHDDLIDSAVDKYHKLRDKLFKPVKGAVKTLDHLKSSDIVLGVITNGDSVKQRDKLQYLGVDEYFDFVIVSDDVGAEKPDRRIFDEALAAARKVSPYNDLKPEECAYVGDKPGDVDGPKKNNWGLVIRMHAGPYGKLKSEKKPDHKIKEFGDFEKIPTLLA